MNKLRSFLYLGLSDTIEAEKPIETKKFSAFLGILNLVD